MNLLELKYFEPRRPARARDKKYRDAIADAMKALANVSIGSGTGLTYRIGSGPGLTLPANADFSGPTATDALGKIKAYGKIVNPNTGQQTPIANYIAEWMTGKSYPSPSSDGLAIKDVGKALSTYGAAPNGVFGNIDRGTFDPNSGKGTKTPASVVGGAGDYGLSAATASAKIGALDTLNNYLYQWGMGQGSGSDLTQWVYNRVMAPGDFKPAAAVLQEMRSTPEYQKRFPGMAMRAANKLPPMSETDYINNEKAYMDAGRNVGLPDGFLSPTEIGILTGHDVSPQEFNDRVTYGYRVVNNLDPQVTKQFERLYNVKKGDLAAYMLDPTRGKDLILKQAQAAVAAGASADTGFSQSLDKDTAEQLAKMQMGSPNSMDATYFRNQFQKIAGLTGLETAQVGQAGQSTASEKTLLSSAFTGLNAMNNTTEEQTQATVQRSLESRAAGLEGGGQFASTAKGVVGLGSASTAGTGSA